MPPQLTQEQYRALITSPADPNDVGQAANIVRQVMGYWNAAGGPNTREDIFIDLMNAGFAPDAASEAVYSQLTDQTAQALSQGIGADQTQQQQLTGGGGGAAQDPEFTPEELQAAQEAHTRSVKSINNAFQAGLLTFDEQQKLINQNRTDLLSQKTRGIGDLERGRDAGIAANTGFFNQVSPDAFQSQQGTFNRKVLDEFGRGETDILNQFNRGVSTLDDNQTRIDLAKRNFQDANEAALADELAQFNLGAGRFTGGDFTSKLNSIRPELSTFNPIAFSANPAGASARPALQSPNAPVGRRSAPVGAQGSAASQDDIDKFLNG